ncbi:MAG: SurA N-terminal domain-containing protein [Bacteroidaceae bacterium]|nr:SurA N-terminal domain-containing protein [Bacteroidaceae bacterium]
MATLQKLRNMGPMLVIFVGVALLAFIAGDAWRILQPHQGSQSVGSVNGEELLATDFQKMYEDYSEVVKTFRGTSSLTEEELNQVKDQVWQDYVRNKVLKAEAEKIGLTVSAAELNAIVSAGQDPILQQTPFVNAQGKFDKSILDNFLAQYAQGDENFKQENLFLYNYWKFVEKTITDNALAYKYQMLIYNTYLSNSVAAQSNFDANSATYDIELAAYPYSAIPSSDVTVSDAEIKALYNKNKEQYKQYSESRNIKYVSYRVTPSDADRAELQKEMAEYAEALKAEDADYSTIVRQANSMVPYSVIAWKKESYPEEVAVRLDEMTANSVVDPIYNQADDSYTTFKFIGKTTAADSIKYRQLAVAAATPEATAALADSIVTALKGGSDFTEAAKKYNQNGQEIWLTSEQYEGMNINSANAKFLQNIFAAKKGEYNVMDIEGSPAKVIYQVIDTKNNVEKYQVAVVKRAVEFSSETYNNAYNKFSQFVASCKNVDDLEKSAEEYGYHVQTQNNIYTSTHKIANQNNTRETLKWIFATAKAGEVSPLYECGNNDNLLVVSLTGVNEKGYMAIEEAGVTLRNKLINDKKAEKIMAELAGKNFEAVASTANVKSDTVKHISFNVPAYISLTSSSEPAICAAVTSMEQGAVSAPIKGNGGVYVIRLIAKNAKDGEYNMNNEQDALKAYGQRATSRFLNDLYEKSEIVDNRYLYF